MNLINCCYYKVCYEEYNAIYECYDMIDSRWLTLEKAEDALRKLVTSGNWKDSQRFSIRIVSLGTLGTLEVNHNEILIISKSYKELIDQFNKELTDVLYTGDEK